MKSLLSRVLQPTLLLALFGLAGLTGCSTGPAPLRVRDDFLWSEGSTGPGSAYNYGGGGGSATQMAMTVDQPLPSRRSSPGGGFLGPTVSRSEFPPIYFDYDDSAIKPSEIQKAEQILSNLRSTSDRMIVAGFTDERGSEDYNLALGSRRAEAVRRHYIANGVNPDRLDTVSYGEELPVSTGGGEGAWAQNRRVESGLVR